MHGGWRDTWRRITLCRHISELRALRFARMLWPLSVFPIFANLGLWWVLAILPMMLVTLALASVGINVFDPARSTDPVAIIIGFIAFFTLSAYALAITILATPWMFRWYFIAVGLSFGRTEMADRKEAELIAAIARNSASDPA